SHPGDRRDPRIGINPKRMPPETAENGSFQAKNVFVRRRGCTPQVNWMEGPAETPRPSSERRNTFFLEECRMRGIRTLLVMLSMAALAVPAVRAQARRPDTAPQGPTGTVQMPRPGGIAG